ncbi:hypothetical protein D3C72_1170840 [compost metagenome]
MQSAHVLQQHLSTFWPDTLDCLKRTGVFHFRAFFTVSADGMVVRLITNMLDHMQRWGIRRQTKALTFRFEEECFQTGLPIGSFCHTKQ